MTLITVNDVQIKGLTVEIKSLTVGKKQLTLSLMRQFIEESIFDLEHMLLKGTPWGFINYFWGDDKEKTPDNYMHLIWQKGGELRRCVLRKEYQTNSHRQDYRYLQGAVKDIDNTINNLTDQIQRKTEILKQIQEDTKTYSYYNKDDITRDIDELQNKVTKNKNDSCEIEERMADIVKFLRDKVPKYNDLVKSMKDLPHFFIAV